MDDRSKILLEMLDAEGGRLLALLQRLTLRREAAEDLLQELVLRLLASKGFAAADNKAAYARRSAINLAFSWRRGHGRRMLALDIEPPDDSPSPHQQVARAQEFEDILAASEKLPDLHRTVFVLHYVEQESYESIALQLGKNPHQVRGLAFRAIQEIRSRLNAPMHTRRISNVQD